ncbi:hypothetical protein GOP47_0030468 [Adiantum capillus-veneris]|nr:hypothetical protein GOP47_0030468 [Adiantum capillus-veneris]
MESTRDKFIDQAIALLHVALTTLKCAHPVSTTAQFSQLHIAVREVMDECSRVERDAFAAEKQALNQTVASQKQQIDKFRADLDDQNERCKILKVDLSSQKAECDQRVADAQQHIHDSDQQIAVLQRQLIEEKQQTQDQRQALGAQVSLLEKELEEKGLLLNELVDQASHLDGQLTEEKEKHLCVVCLDKPRDTLIMPCLHFHYCFCCLMQHKQANGSTCPTCRGSIQGLCMSSFLT